MNDNDHLTTLPGKGTEDKLHQLRRILIRERLDYYVVPSTDAHGSEYLAERDQRLEFISGFTGSAGTAVIGLQTARLFTDSRYWLQAQKELDGANWTLMRTGAEGVPDWNVWLTSDVVNISTRVGIDPLLISHSSADSLIASLSHKESVLIYPTTNCVDAVWGTDRPAESEEGREVYIHPMKYAGQSASDKISKLRKHIVEQVPNSPKPGYLISSLSELCWCLNIRGKDVPYNPFPFAYLYISLDSIVLFINKRKTKNPEVVDYLNELQVRIEPYEEIFPYLSGLSDLVIIDSNQSVAVSRKISALKLVNNPSVITFWKALKNPAELEGFRNAYLRDGAAWCRWAAWLEAEMSKENSSIDEWQAAIEFDRFRNQDKMFIDLAYPNISATNSNAALPHYEPTPKQRRTIDRETMYLNDSGAHYLDGTTDTTRTAFFGDCPSQDHKLAYTTVLQGHIAVASAIFPGGGDVATKSITRTTGSQLDVLARQPGWRHGLLYGHGTGHSVGCCSSVHEGPHGIGTSSRAVDVFLEAGHCFTVEPGHYSFEKKIGCRIESFYGVRKCLVDTSMTGSEWLSLERFTQVPISKKLIEWSLLSQSEKSWIETHNEECKEKLIGLFDETNSHDRLAIAWLKKQ